MDTNKNLYTILYATLMVIIVAAVLAFVSDSLKERQQRNVDLETKRSILSSVDLISDIEKKDNKTAYIEKQYDKYITSFVLNIKGKKIKGDASKVNLAHQTKILKAAKDLTGNERAKALKDIKLPIFICTLDTNKVLSIIPIYGAGLWGPIWGYISLDPDFNTIYGATFGHKGETPGLGSEIATQEFSNQLIGKKIFDNEIFTSIIIAKGGAKEGTINEIDAISGGTITSNALESAIRSWVELYLTYINVQKDALISAQVDSLIKSQVDLQKKPQVKPRSRVKRKVTPRAKRQINSQTTPQVKTRVTPQVSSTQVIPQVSTQVTPQVIPQVIPRVNPRIDSLKINNLQDENGNI